jgi:hypothetical protein
MATPIGWGRTASVGGPDPWRPSRSAHDIGPIDPFGFSWRLAVSLWKPPFWAIGFPWISLDSLVRIEPSQWVMRDFRWKFFPRGFSPLRGAGTEAGGRSHAEAQE